MNINYMIYKTRKIEVKLFMTYLVEHKHFHKKYIYNRGKQKNYIKKKKIKNEWKLNENQDTEVYEEMISIISACNVPFDTITPPEGNIILRPSISATKFNWLPSQSLT